MKIIFFVAFVVIMITIYKMVYYSHNFITNSG